MSSYTWGLLCELVEFGPIRNYWLISSEILTELREIGVALPLYQADESMVLTVTCLGRHEYRNVN